MSGSQSSEIGSKKKRSGGRLGRSETVSVRLDARLRYIAELAARKQRRTVSSFIEWAIEETLKVTNLTEETDFDGKRSFWEAASQLWDVSDSDRFAKLAFNYPDLLTYEEQVLWKLIRENGLLWRGSYSGPNNQWVWEVEKRNFAYNKLREHWDTFVKVAQEELDHSKLPTWEKERKPPIVQAKVQNASLDDEIPF